MLYVWHGGRKSTVGNERDRFSHGAWHDGALSHGWTFRGRMGWLIITLQQAYTLTIWDEEENKNPQR